MDEMRMGEGKFVSMLDTLWSLSVNIYMFTANTSWIPSGDDVAIGGQNIDIIYGGE